MTRNHTPDMMDWLNTVMNEENYKKYVSPPTLFIFGQLRQSSIVLPQFIENIRDIAYHFRDSGPLGYFCIVLYSFLLSLALFIMALLLVVCTVAIMTTAIVLEPIIMITRLIGGALFAGINVVVCDMLTPTIDSLARFIDSLGRFKSPVTKSEDGVEKGMEMTLMGKKS